MHRRRLLMAWLSSNWIWLLAGAAFLAFHLFGHGGHRGHGGHDGHGDPGLQPTSDYADPIVTDPASEAAPAQVTPARRPDQHR
jgi:hypothetical protein